MNYRQELHRKGIHQLALSIPICYIFFSKMFILQVLIPITCLVVIVDVARLKFPWVKKQFIRIFGTVLRPHEIHRLTGSSYLLIGTVLTLWLFPKNYVILSLFFLIISDSVASLVGKQFGKHKIFGKSIEGSAAFFISALLIALFFTTIPISHAIIGAAAATIIELLPLQIDDNFLIPLLTCFVIWIILL